MPLPGLMGLNWVTSTRQIPFWGRRLALSVYCPYPFVWMVSFPMLLSTCCFVVALAVYHAASAMLNIIDKSYAITKEEMMASLLLMINLIVFMSTICQA